MDHKLHVDQPGNQHLPEAQSTHPVNFAFTDKDASSNAKIAQLRENTVRIPEDGVSMTTHFGSGVDNTSAWLKAGARGPSDINDFHGREKIHHFDHERIPERVVHARGAGAHGVFKLNESLEDVTVAKMFTEVGKETPLFVRFSTVLGSRGSADTVRDTRGFAVKFYTDEGNWDLVGNDIPVFFINEGMQFPDVIHAGKPAPHSEIPQAQTAHDNFWDFISLSPQSLHHALWALSDRGIPRSYRHIAGFGVNTFLFTKGEDDWTFVKFHIRPKLGVHSLVWDEALKLAGQDPDFHRRDLYDCIDAGAFPEYDFGVQLVKKEDEHKFDFDLLDCTKLIPESEVPIRFVGTITLNRKPQDYFSEVENVAFCTQNIVRGLWYSHDPMLAARNFSYLDTQLSRLRTPNHYQFPINRGRCPVISTMRDGAAPHQLPAGPNYYPNRFSVPRPATEKDDKPGAIIIPKQPIESGAFTARINGEKFKEHLNQPRLFYNSLSNVEKANLIAAAQFELGRCTDRVVRERMILRFNDIDHGLAVKVAEGFDVVVPESKYKNDGRKDPHLAQISEFNPGSASGRRVCIFAFDGYDGAQVAALQGAITASGSIPQLLGSAIGYCYPRGTTRGKDEPTATSFESQWTQETARSTLFDAIIIPSGDENYQKALRSGRVVHLAAEAYGHKKLVAALGHGVDWLITRALPGQIKTPAEADGYIAQPGVVLFHQAKEGTQGLESSSGLISKAVGMAKQMSFTAAFNHEAAKHRAWERDTSEVAY